MSIGKLLAWQWQGYARYHVNKKNLLLHIFAVPAVLIGNVMLIVGAVRLSILSVGIGAVLTVLGFALQGRGHKLEPTPPEPFTGPADAIIRLFMGQWVTFPRFVLGGGWLKAIKNAT